MSERLDPEEVTGIMGRFKAEAERIVSTHGGTVNQFVGDEVFALFGIPTAHEDDPARAVRAALELHEAVRALSDEIEARLGETLRLHSGINTGLVVTAPGDGTGGRYTVTGDTVNTAARMVSRAETDRILVGDSTRRQVAPFYDLEELEPVTVKGKARPLVPYRVLGASGVASRFEAAEARGFTPYTGREADRATLHEALERTTAGEGQFITVSGEAGLGKSRLLYEFRREIDREAVIVLQGRCQSFGIATPYLPLTNALRRGLELREEDAPAQLHAKAVAGLRAIDSALEEMLPVYLHLLSIPSSEHPLPENLSGEALRHASQVAIAAVNLSNARRRPMVLILEDWHWADEASDTALRHLLGMLGESQLMVVVNYRPEFTGEWEGTLNHQHLTLGPLSEDHTAIIAKSVLEAKRLPDELGELIHQRTGGNPFFIEEMCLDLLEEGIVLVKDGQAALTRLAEKLDLPGTVQAVIRSRLDRLSEPQQELLRVASVIGREFGLPLLSQAYRTLEYNHEDIREHLQALTTQGLIQQVRVLPEPEYIFRHVLTQVVNYETLLHERRRELHGIIGCAIKVLYSKRLEEHYEILAHQFSRSNDQDNAVDFLGLSGKKATVQFSWETARSDFLEAIGILRTLPISTERKIKWIDLTLQLVTVTYHAPTREILEALESAEGYARDLKDDSRLLLVTYNIGRLHYVLGHMGTYSYAAFEKAIGLAKDNRNEEILVRSTNYQGRICFHTADLHRGIEILETGIPDLNRLGNIPEMIYSQSILARIYGLTGDFSKAFDMCEFALQNSRDNQNQDRESNSSLFYGFVYALQGDWEKVIQRAVFGKEIAERLGNRLMIGVGKCILGYASFMQGKRDFGIKTMQEGFNFDETPGVHPMLIWEAWHAEILALSNQKQEAQNSLKIIQNIRTISGQRSGDIVAQRAMGILKAHGSRPNWNDIVENLALGIEMATERGARPDLAVSHFRHAEILHKKGDLPESREQLDRAAALFADMGMTWWADQSEALRGRIERGEPFRGFAPYAE